VRKEHLANNPTLHQMVTGNFLEATAETIHLPGTHRKTFLHLLELHQCKGAGTRVNKLTEKLKLLYFGEPCNEAAFFRVFDLLLEMQKYDANFGVDNIFAALRRRTDYSLGVFVGYLNVTAIWKRFSTPLLNKLSGADPKHLWDYLQLYPLIVDTVLGILSPDALAWVAVHKNDPILLEQASIPDDSSFRQLALLARWAVLSKLTTQTVARVNATTPASAT